MANSMCISCNKYCVCKYVEDYNKIAEQLQLAQIKNSDIFDITITCKYFDNGLTCHGSGLYGGGYNPLREYVYGASITDGPTILTDVNLENAKEV